MTKEKIKMSSGIKKTILGFLLITLIMGVVFNFKIPLYYSHNGHMEANIILWPISQFGELMVYHWFNIGETNTWGHVLSFFFVESIYILLVLYIFSFMFNFVRGFSSEIEVAEWLQSKDGVAGRIVGAIFGFISPFCSCSTVPVVTSMVKSRIPMGTLVAFLITSPMINEVGIALLLSNFGYKVTLIYVAFGFVIGIFGSYFSSLFKLENQIKIKLDKVNKKQKRLLYKITFYSMYKKGTQEAKKMLKKFWWILVIAMAVGSLMHGFLPEEWIRQHVHNMWWAPLVMVPMGAVLYLNISATIPIINQLVQSGTGLGPAMGFMMGVNTLSFPEIIILTRIFKKKFMFFFVTYLLVAILIFSYALLLIPDGVLI